MSDISELFDRCVAMHKAGEHAVAAQGYAAILRADPNHADTKVAEETRFLRKEHIAYHIA